ncbi:hypothetical protein N7492_009205 [Penicillium capsulatum]|uniref:Uncharacterized protein n=1 Tax=Penicillium capsulatum TaxID=69766 RepID=A0A9W9LHV2_9EURO|nr:hypothetical protein N7492_009205 [Penicillium capsulatum]KAJ6106601.1 hypothetical protein N7512_010118 [Penicillium capsulatum]
MEKLAVVFRQPSLMLFLVIVFMARICHASDTHALGLLPRSDKSCPSSYSSCGSKLPDGFCCSSSSTCISLDDATSAICCPSGSNCDYISPIVCDVKAQNTTLHPKSTIKTTRLDEDLPKCGEACCPFGYTCHGNNTCVMDKSSSNTTTASSTTSAATDGASVTPISSPSTSAAAVASASTSCPSFPSKAIAAGFFPGAAFGAVLALLITTCLRRRAQKKQLESQEDYKSSKSSNPLSHWSHRSSSGGIKGISSPIASEDTSCRTDFLLRPFILQPGRASVRKSMDGRSRRSTMHRTSGRVRSLFSGPGGPKLDKNVPPVPVVPRTPPGQRAPSTESIKVYSPPGVFSQSKKFLGPEPYPGTIARPDTTFSDLVKAVGFNDAKGNPSFKVTPEKTA